MPIRRRIATPVMKKIAGIEDFAKTMRKGRAKATPAEERRIRKEAREALSTMVKLTKAGTPVNAVDKAVFQLLRKNETKVRKQMKTIFSRRTPGLRDYYLIYHDVLKDSGLVSLGKLDPGVLDSVKANDCNYCKACSVCAGCAAGYVVGLGLMVGMAGAAT